MWTHKERNIMIVIYSFFSDFLFFDTILCKNKTPIFSILTTHSNKETIYIYKKQNQSKSIYFDNFESSIFLNSYSNSLNISKIKK